MKDRNGNHICMMSGCCEYTEPSSFAIGVIDRLNNLHPYEWFKAEAEQTARRATVISAVVVVILFSIAFLIFA